MGQAFTGAAARRFIPHHRPAMCFTAPPDLRSVSDHGVGVPRRQEVEFADGSRIWLLRVERDGAPDLFLRELALPAGGVLVDLRKLVPDLARDLPRAATRDVPGIVHYSLRGRFHARHELIEAAVVFGRPA